MAFGKRVNSEPVIAGADAFDVEEHATTFADRLSDLRDEMLRINREASDLASLVRDGRRSPDYVPRSDCVSIDGLSRRFDHASAGEKRHSVYVYLTADGTASRQAQVHLFDLTTRITYLNTICRTCSDQEELRIALLAPQPKASIDFILAMSAFFSAYFANTSTAVAHVTAAPGTGKRGFDFVRMRDVITESLEDARLYSLDPAGFANHIPAFEWPMVGGAIEVSDHEGQAVINEIYLPSEIAGTILSAASPVQGHAAAGTAAVAA